MEWEFTLERFGGGWWWTARPVGRDAKYSDWAFTKSGARWKMRRLAKRVMKEEASKETWTEKV